LANQTSQNCIVLLSAGLDSLVSLAMAKDQGYEIQLAITVNYGQQAANQEIAYAGAICDYYKIKHQIIDIRDLMLGIKSGLLTGNIPSITEHQLNNEAITKDSASRVWVPNRNGFLINLAAMYAENNNCNWIITGFNKEEAATFPDNSGAFIEAINQSLAYSTSNQVRVISFTQELTKLDIIDVAIKLEVPLKLVWSCYYGGAKMCGVCESCQRLQRAIKPHQQILKQISFS